MIEKNFDPHPCGDTFDEVQFELIINGAPKDITGAVIKADFKSNKKSAAVKTLSTDDNTIIITDGAAGQFKWNPFLADMAAGSWYWDIQFTFPGGRVKTYFFGTLPLEDDVTD